MIYDETRARLDVEVSDAEVLACPACHEYFERWPLAMPGKRDLFVPVEKRKAAHALVHIRKRDGA